MDSRLKFVHAGTGEKQANLRRQHRSIRGIWTVKEPLHRPNNSVVEICCKKQRTRPFQGIRRWCEVHGVSQRSRLCMDSFNVTQRNLAFRSLCCTRSNLARFRTFRFAPAFVRMGDQTCLCSCSYPLLIKAPNVVVLKGRYARQVRDSNSWW